MAVLEKPWMRACAAGLLAGFLGGEAFLAVGLLRDGTDLLVTSPSLGFVVALVLRSVGVYGLLFAAAGLVLAAALHFPLTRLGRKRWPAFAVVSAAMTSFIVFCYLTVHWQLDLLAGLPLNEADRWQYALLHLVVALFAGSAVGLVLARLGPRWPAASKWTSRGTVVALVIPLLSGISIPVGDVMLGRSGAAVERRPARVVVAAVDGVCFRVLSPLMRAGRLPSFDRLMADGAWGSLMTYGTAHSARVWTSIATGKRVRDHGIDDFVKVGNRYRAVPMKSSDRKVRAIWDILGETGRRVAIVDWLLTYPPETVNGYMVTRLQFDAKERTYPPGLEEELRPLLTTEPQSSFSRRDVFFGQIDRAFDVALELYRREPLDFLAVYQHTTDAVSHTFWKYHEPEAFDPDLWGLVPHDVQRHREVLSDVYARLDLRLGELLDALDDDTMLIVVSDHGQQAAKRPKYTVRLDRILADLGFARMRHDDPNAIDFAASRAYPLVETLGKPRLRINLNLDNREPTGIVPRSEAGLLAGDISAALRQLRLDDGARLFGEIRQSDFDGGPRSATQGADLQVALSRRWSDGSSLESSVVVAGTTYPLSRFVDVDTTISGNHHHQGVFFVHGPGVRPGYLGQRTVTTAFQEILWHLTDKIDAVDSLLPLCIRLGLIDRVSTLDLTPTVLHSLGLPVARDMAGRPLPEIFANPPMIEWIDTYEGVSPKDTAAEEVPSDEEVVEQLRALGYVN